MSKVLGLLADKAYWFECYKGRSNVWKLIHDNVGFETSVVKAMFHSKRLVAWKQWGGVRPSLYTMF